MQYKVNDTFYSLQGEGAWTGAPMFFIRLSGCNLNCKFCDTAYKTYTEYDEDQLVEMVDGTAAERVVITGGEPMLQSVGTLLKALHDKGYTIHLETNGTVFSPYYPDFDFIALSPKSAKLDIGAVDWADELKFLVGLPDWEKIITEVVDTYHPTAKLRVMPLATKVDWEKNTQEAINYCLTHPKFSLCPQTHKYLNFK